MNEILRRRKSEIENTHFRKARFSSIRPTRGVNEILHAGETLICFLFVEKFDKECQNLMSKYIFTLKGYSGIQDVMIVEQLSHIFAICQLKRFVSHSLLYQLSLDIIDNSTFSF